MHPCIVFFKWSQLGAHYFLVYLFQLLYMFRATMCPSPGQLTISMRHWYISLCMGGCLVCWLGWVDQTAMHTEWKIPVSHRYGLIPTSRPDSHAYRVKNTSVAYIYGLIPTSRPDSHPYKSQPANQTAMHTEWKIPVSHIYMVSSQPADQTATRTEWKIPVSHRYGKLSWWWAYSCPKHVEKLK